MARQDRGHATLTLPVLVLTLGLFTLVLSAVMLWLTSATSDLLGLRFHVEVSARHSSAP